MHRTQISLREDQYRQLLDRARRMQISLAELIRRLADDFLKERAQDDPLKDLKGTGRGNGEAVGRNHDRYLYGDRG